MVHTVKVFLAEEALVALEDHFVDKDEDALRKYIFDQVKGLARSAKLVRMNKSFAGNIEVKDGRPNETKMETWYLKDVRLDKFTVKEDPSWIPKNMDKDDVKIYYLKIGEKTWEALQIYVQVYSARLKFYNDSLDESDSRYNDKLLEKPDCFEQVIHEAIIPQVYQKISANIDDELEKEFDKVNEPPEKKKPKKKK